MQKPIFQNFLSEIFPKVSKGFETTKRNINKVTVAISRGAFFWMAFFTLLIIIIHICAYNYSTIQVIISILEQSSK